MSDFSDRPFVAGSLTGLRVFDVDPLGRLRGVTVSRVFKPGENTAVCSGRAGGMPSYGGFSSTLRIYRSAFAALGSEGEEVEATKPVTVVDAPPHVVANVSCACGYYAYYDTAANPYSGDDKVTALIQGYGVCSVGTRGFRAEKARLVALVNTRPAVKTHSERWDAWSDWQYRHDGWSSIVVVGGGLGAFWSAIGAIAGFANELPWLGVALACLFGLLTPLSIQSARGWSHGLWRRPPYPRLRGCPDESGGVPWDLIRRNYPDVPVYGSLRAALADHPLTSPPAPGPEDADFWTQP